MVEPTSSSAATLGQSASGDEDKASAESAEARRARLDAEIDSELDKALAAALCANAGGDERARGEEVLLKRVRDGFRAAIDTEIARFETRFEARLTQIITNSSTAAVQAVQKHLKGTR